ncbi:reverse transcriptase domain-containing protein [Tanacetum coccineum]
MEKFKTPPDSPPVIDPDDQPMWSSTRIVVPTPRPAIVQLSISNNFHIKEINNLFQYGENQEEAVMLRTFPFLLSGEAKTWLNELNNGIITSWNELREAFISRYFCPARFKRLLNEIHSFHQLNHESLIKAWLRMKEMLRTCYRHGQTKGAIIQIFYHGLDDPTQGILDAVGIFLYKTPNEVFTILEDMVLLKLDFLDDFQNNPKSKTVVSAGRSNLNSDHAILMDKFETLATKIDSKFLIVRKELKEMRDSRSDDEGNHASRIYMRDDTSMCEPQEANYTEANERMKDQVVELKNRINQGLRNHQAIIQILERQFQYLEKIPQTKSLPHTTNTKQRHEFVDKQPSIRNENDKGDVEFIKEDEIKPILTVPNPKPINSNSPTVSPFLKDCIVHIPYMNAKTFTDDVLPNHVGEKDAKGTQQRVDDE